MKKRSIIVVLILLTAGAAQAQLRFGVKAGVNASKVFNISSVVDDQSPAANFQIGGVMQYDFWIFTLQPELNFSRKGGRLNNAYDKYYLQQYAGLTEDAPALNFTTNHIELPVNLLYKVNVGKAKIFAEMGPFVSFNLGGTFNGSKAKYDQYADQLPFHWIDYGVGAGAGLEFKKFQLNAKWDWGLNWIGSKVTGINETGNTNVFNDMKYLNLSLSVGYFF
jgi:hypothetical protein